MSDDEREDCIVPKKFKFSSEKNEKTYEGDKVDISYDGNIEAGSYFLGPVIKKYYSSTCVQCIVRKKKTGECYLMKILLLDDLNALDEFALEKRTIFHNEYSILSLLRNCPGVIQVHDFFKDYVWKEDGETNKAKLKRVCMVLDCLIPHGHHNQEQIRLLDLVLKRKINETEALHIFYNLLLVVEELNKRNLHHRNIRLSNIILNKRTLKVKLVDFYYAEFMAPNENKHGEHKNFFYFPYNGLWEDGYFPDTCDVCSAGIAFFEMLNGWVFHGGDSGHRPTMPLIKAACKFYIGLMDNDWRNNIASHGTKKLVTRVLSTSTQNKLNASEVLDMVSTLIATRSASLAVFQEGYLNDQIAPACPQFDSKDDQKSEVKLASKSFVVPEVPTLSQEDIKEQEEKKNEITKTDDNLLRLSKTQNKISQQGLLENKQIKVAMLRLGATSINCIDALSFSYSKKKSSQF